MRFKDLKEKTWFRILSNKYVLILLVFAVWMFFFDSNSYFFHRELDKERESLENNKAYFEEEIKKDRAVIEQLQDKDGLEKFARENYFMKKDNEDVYIIEFEDSIKTK